MQNSTLNLGPELPEVDYQREPPTGPRLAAVANCAEENTGDENCNNYYPTEQEYLKQKAQATTTGQTLWQNYPKGGSSLAASLPEKDPLISFKDVFGLIP